MSRSAAAGRVEAWLARQPGRFFGAALFLFPTSGFLHAPNLHTIGGMKPYIPLALSALIAGAPAPLCAEECRNLQNSSQRLACYDQQSDLHSALRHMVAVTLRLSFNASMACGFVLDTDRFKRQLLTADLTYGQISDSQTFSEDDLKIIADDAQASANTNPDSAYCQKAWSTYGTDASLPDNVFIDASRKQIALQHRCQVIS